MQAIHEKRLIHRDLKLNNILMKENSTLQISGLSLSFALRKCKKLKICEKNLVELNLETISYKALEIIQNQFYGAQVDRFLADLEQIMN